MGKIADTHDELFHYTTAAGLSGILESKFLRATHASFMNDEEEIVGFYDRILPKILHPVFLKYAEESRDHPEFRRQQRDMSFEHYCADRFEEVMSSIKKSASSWHDHYIASFSTTTAPLVLEHGLLSQWRAYGSDGGYAIVFDAKALDEILQAESKPDQEEEFSWVDVQYTGLDGNRRTSDTDTNEWIGKLEDAAGAFLRSGTTDDSSKLVSLLTVLSATFKHRGFDEEREVRLVLSLLGPSLESNPALKSIRQHPIKTMVRDGTTVPYVELCAREVNGVKQHLPIKRIIVGPHRDKSDRKRAVQLLLKQHGLDDLIGKVSVSDIPYRGR